MREGVGMGAGLGPSFAGASPHPYAFVREDDVDLSNHKVYGPEGGFTEFGYRFYAWQPANHKARRVAILQAFRDAECVEREVLLSFAYREGRGMDDSDVLVVHEALDRLVGELTPERERR